MKNAAMTILVMATFVFPVSSPVSATVEFKDGGTYIIDYVINGDVWVDHGEPGMGTTVNLVDGGSIAYPPGGYLIAFEDSMVNILGGSITFHVFAYDRSQVYISGGSIGTDPFGKVLAYDNSYVSISDGFIDGDVHALGSSQVDISGGSIVGALWALDNCQVDILGGSVGYDMYVMNSGQVNISGGSIARYLMPFDNAVVTIHGSGFAVDGVPFYGELASIYGGWWTKEPVRHLTGTLTSGEPIDNDFYISYDSKIILVPESAIIEANIDIKPDTLNLIGKMKWITCYIELPVGYDVSDIDIDTILLENLLTVQNTEIQENVLIVKFEKQSLVDYLDGATGYITLTVNGELNYGTLFEGIDTIFVIERGRGRPE